MIEPRSAIGMLMHEHRVILRAIDDMRTELERDTHGNATDLDYIAIIADFIRTYADRCHHGKEEDILFADLADKEMPPHLTEEMQRLIDDHVWARGTTRRMVDAAQRCGAGDDSARDEVIDAMSALVGFYPGHIEREDHGFFRPAIGLFTAEERDQMAGRFRDFDRRLIHEHYADVVDRLETRRSDLR